MPPVKCHRCGNSGSDPEQCESCGLVYREYEKAKQAAIGRVYSLISSGELEAARELARQSGKEFPDSRTDFVLLLSNIERDISIVAKYEKALLAFDRGEYDQVVLLLRNIKAFDQILDGKVISLRRKAERLNDLDPVFEEAVQCFDRGEYGRALQLFKKIDGCARRDEVDSYLIKIDELKNSLFKEAVALLRDNQLEGSRKKFEQLHSVVPEMAEQTAPYLAVIEKKNEIREKLLALAARARQDNRMVEARVIYSYLCWQWPDQRARIEPYLEALEPVYEIHLADSVDNGTLDCSGLGLELDRYGFFVSGKHPDKIRKSGELQSASGIGINPEPLADPLPPPADIDGEGIADFTY
jgi:tetratricopeptide (TPR) repeat protein